MKHMTCVLSIAIFLIASVSFASQPVVKKGDTAIVPDSDWVDVLNQEVVYSGNNEFVYGESCRIKRGGTVSVIDEIDEIDILVRYTTPNNEESLGAPCPSGIIFQISKETFLQMTAAYKGQMKAEQERRQKIADVVKNAEK